MESTNLIPEEPIETESQARELHGADIDPWHSCHSEQLGLHVGLLTVGAGADFDSVASLWDPFPLLDCIV